MKWNSPGQDLKIGTMVLVKESQLLHHLEAFVLQPGEYVPDVTFSSSRFGVAIGCWTDPTATAVIASAPRRRDPTNATLAHYHGGKLLNIVTIQR
ncbi:unnamed protein product, partial [Iphiclides podalirius]